MLFTRAALWAGRLRARDLPVQSVRNARRMDRPDTVIYYREGAERTALDVRRLLGRRGWLVPSGGESPYVVRVVLGRDILRPKEKKQPKIPGERTPARRRDAAAGHSSRGRLK